MPILIALLSLLTVLPLAAGTHSHHHTIWTTGDSEIEIRVVREDDGDNYATFTRNGVRYITTDAGVLAEIEKAMEAHRRFSQEHSRIGRKHSEIGREHSRIGREHSKLGREMSRTGVTPEIERRQRELEAEQRKLEDRQRALEGEQRELEAQQRASEKDVEKSLKSIFERAVREGKAKRQ